MPVRKPACCGTPAPARRCRRTAEHHEHLPALVAIRRPPPPAIAVFGPVRTADTVLLDWRSIDCAAPRNPTSMRPPWSQYAKTSGRPRRPWRCRESPSPIDRAARPAGADGAGFVDEHDVRRVRVPGQVRGADAGRCPRSRRSRSNSSRAAATSSSRPGERRAIALSRLRHPMTAETPRDPPCAP